MKFDELTKSLRRLKVETGSLVCLGCGHEHRCSVRGCAIIRSASEVIEQQRKEIESLRQVNSGLRYNLQQLANGVVVLPCRCGDTLYDIYEAFYNGEGDARALKVTDIHIHLDKRNKAWIIIGGYYFALDDFGKTVFLTREEAEEALEKRKGGDE